jgi:hypothetical protein
MTQAQRELIAGDLSDAGIIARHAGHRAADFRVDRRCFSQWRFSGGAYRNKPAWAYARAVAYSVALRPGHDLPNLRGSNTDRNRAPPLSNQGGSGPHRKQPTCNRSGLGAANRTRTCDPVITNDVLYQLSYCGGPCSALKASRPRTLGHRDIGHRASLQEPASGGLSGRGRFAVEWDPRR